MRSFPLILLLSCGLVSPGHSAPTAEELQFFETKIRPVLADKCYNCHSVNAEKLKGDLLVDHIQSLMEGGDTGPSLVPGKPDESLLIEAISYKNIDLQMPPKSKLSDTHIADMNRWVEMGAPWPEEPLPKGKTGKAVFDWQSRKEGHWCWQPIKAVRPPQPPGIDWARNASDWFIYDALKEAGLSPAREADRRTWIRRVYFALIGLPPTVEQVRAFLDDASPAAYEKVVDALLVSPHYGERWGRHWLDLARYAESCGHEFDYTLEQAYEYRDYVIRAFNLDLPYDQFMTEQVAGDLLPSPRRNPEEGFNESIIGTGFWYLHEAVHAPTDVMKDESDRMDNQIDVFGKTFMGLTIACARCHDHKFDAISTRDYYSLAGFLQSSRMQYVPLDLNGKITAAVKQLEPLRAKQRAGSSSANRRQIGPYLLAAQRAIDWKEPIPETTPSEELLGADIVFADFEQGTYDGWTISGGDAFGEKPSTGSHASNQKVAKFNGKYLVNTWPKTDAAVGTAESKTFTIDRDFIHLLVGGGKHKGKTCVELVVGKKAVFSAHGENSDTLVQRSWDVKKYKGKTAHIRIVDNHKSGWGHVLVDDIVFSNTPAKAGKSSGGTVPAPVIAKVAEMSKLDPVVLKRYITALVDKASERDDHPLFAWKQYAEKPEGIQRFVDLAEEPKHFEAKGEVMAGFAGDDFDGCFVSGHAFGRGPVQGVADSGYLSRKLHGALRTPTFTLNGNVFFRINATRANVRLIIDSYQMQPRNGLLFGGTAIKNLDTKGNWEWRSLGNKKYDGHKAYLEFVDEGDGFVAIDQIVRGDPPANKMHPVNRDVFAAKPGKLQQVAAAYGDAIDLGWFVAREMLPLDQAEIDARIVEIEKLMPKPRRVLAMADGTGENDHVYIRGNPHTKGELAPRQMPLAIFGAQQRTFRPEDGSGRLHLATQLTDPANPFPARVMVNRIWHHLFGRGIVPSVDDFGEMGQPPSHPELLDWLAHDFVHDKQWSVKAMIKSLVLSSTYRQSSRPVDAHPDAAEVDPLNTLLYRMPIRRLEAEPIRDAVYAISGRLDRKMYGPGIPVYLNRFQGGRGKPSSGPLDGNGRRSIYLAVRRNFMSSMMLTFDYPTPFNSIGRRNVSNVPAQALALMNNPAMVDEAKRWGKAVAATAKTPQERIELAYEQAFARLPTEIQLEKMKRFAKNQATLYNTTIDDERVWADLCHVLFNMKEFIYIN